MNRTNSSASRSSHFNNRLSILFLLIFLFKPAFSTIYLNAFTIIDNCGGRKIVTVYWMLTTCQAPSKQVVHYLM